MNTNEYEWSEAPNAWDAWRTEIPSGCQTGLCLNGNRDRPEWRRSPIRVYSCSFVSPTPRRPAKWRQMMTFSDTIPAVFSDFKALHGLWMMNTGLLSARNALKPPWIGSNWLGCRHFGTRMDTD